MNRSSYSSIKEYQKREVYSGRRGPSGENVRIYSNDRSYEHIYDSYVLFDSRLKSDADSNLNRSILGFRLVNIATTGSNKAVRVDDFIKNIYELETYYLEIPNVIADNPNLLAYNRIWLTLINLERQSIMAIDNRHYHFEYLPEIDGDRIRLIPLDETRKFVLKNPITSFESMRFQISSPGQPSFNLPNDLIRSPTFVTGSNPAQFISTDHGLNTGDAIFIKCFRSNSNQVNNEINTELGHQVTVIDPDTFTIPIDATLATIAPTKEYEIRIPKNTILIRMRIRSVTTEKTNPIQPD